MVLLERVLMWNVLLSFKVYCFVQTGFVHPTKIVNTYRSIEWKEYFNAIIILLLIISLYGNSQSNSWIIWFTEDL